MSTILRAQVRLATEAVYSKSLPTLRAPGAFTLSYCCHYNYYHTIYSRYCFLVPQVRLAMEALLEPRRKLRDKLAAQQQAAA